MERIMTRTIKETFKKTKAIVTAQFFGILLVTLKIQFSFAAVPSPDCSRSNVLCLEEYLTQLESSRSMNEAIDLIPNYIKRNVTFKRGNNIEKRTVGVLGPHGHKVSNNNSQSATPDQPRAFVWDESSGFTASWNSGNPQHSASDRMDLYGFDFSNKTHQLKAYFPGTGQIVDEHFKDQNSNTCLTCHGPNARPIFPMYPDWPQFYGEFNDELSGYPRGSLALRSDLRVMANEVQPIERELFFDFIRGEGRSNARYSKVLDQKPVFQNSNSFYPYRPDTTTSPFSSVSRAFANRPNLRLGVLYNRLTALQTFEKIKKSPIFKKYPDIIFYSLMDCNWDFVDGQGQTGRDQILSPFLEDVQKISSLKNINLRGVKYNSNDLTDRQKQDYFAETENGQTVYYKSPAYNSRNYRQIPYEDLLQILNLDLRDLDIRFKYDSKLKVNKGYNVYDPKAFHFTDSVMDIGYVEPTYVLNPICDNNNKSCLFSYDNTYMQGMKYFNSYFDGSATTNELLVAQMLLYFTDRSENFQNDPDLIEIRNHFRSRVSNPDVYFETLMKKYSHFTARLNLDREFFGRMDSIGPWIQLPYPPDLINVHNRESFWETGRNGRTQAIRHRHAQWTSLQNRQNNVKNLSGGNNLCWITYDSMHRRYRTQN